MMPNFADLQAASNSALSKENTYWINLIGLLETFGEQFVTFLDLPMQTFDWKGQERRFVTFTQKQSIGTSKTFDPANYEKKERSIPFTITVVLPNASRDTIREISIDLALSSRNGQPSIYSAEFTDGPGSVPYDYRTSRGLMEKITNALKAKAEMV